SFEVFPPETLERENEIENDKVVSSLKAYVAIPLVERKDVPPGGLETRALVLTFAAPVLDSQGTMVGAVIAGKVINKDTSIVGDIRTLLKDQATFFLGKLRVSTTRTQNGIGTFNRGPSSDATENGSYTERPGPRRVEGEQLMGVFDPVKDLDGVVLGSLYIG